MHICKYLHTIFTLFVSLLYKISFQYFLTYMRFFHIILSSVRKTKWRPKANLNIFFFFKNCAFSEVQHLCFMIEIHHLIISR